MTRTPGTWSHVSMGPNKWGRNNWGDAIICRNEYTDNGQVRFTDLIRHHLISKTLPARWEPVGESAASEILDVSNHSTDDCFFNAKQSVFFPMEFLTRIPNLTRPRAAIHHGHMAYGLTIALRFISLKKDAPNSMWLSIFTCLSTQKWSSWIVSGLGLKPEVVEGFLG